MNVNGEKKSDRKETASWFLSDSHSAKGFTVRGERCSAAEKHSVGKKTFTNAQTTFWT